MGISTSDPNEEVLLLKSSQIPMKTIKMSKVSEIVQMSQTLPNQRVRKNDEFKMPVIDFSFKRNFVELIGLNYMNRELFDYHIKEMY